MKRKAFNLLYLLACTDLETIVKVHGAFSNANNDIDGLYDWHFVSILYADIDKVIVKMYSADLSKFTILTLPFDKFVRNFKPLK